MEIIQEGICHPLPIWQVSVQSICGKVNKKYEQFYFGVLADAWKSSSRLFKSLNVSLVVLQSCSDNWSRKKHQKKTKSRVVTLKSWLTKLGEESDFSPSLALGSDPMQEALLSQALTLPADAL